MILGGKLRAPLDRRWGRPPLGWTFHINVGCETRSRLTPTPPPLLLTPKIWATFGLPDTHAGLNVRSEGRLGGE